MLFNFRRQEGITQNQALESVSIYGEKMDTFGFLQPGATQPREEIFDLFQKKWRGLP